MTEADIQRAESVLDRAVIEMDVLRAERDRARTESTLLRAENARLRDALKTIADGPSPLHRRAGSEGP